MYIRRKVYSAVEDENGEIRYFSTNEIISEEDYIEKLYSEFYLDDDDVERIFSEKDYDKGLSKGAKIAIGAGSAAAAATALHFGGRHAAKKAAKGWELNLAERGLKKVNEGEKWLWDKTGRKVAGKVDTKRAVKALGTDFNYTREDLLAMKPENIERMVEANLLTRKRADSILKQQISIKEKEAAAEAKAKAKQSAKNAKVVSDLKEHGGQHTKGEGKRDLSQRLPSGFEKLEAQSSGTGRAAELRAKYGRKK